MFIKSSVKIQWLTTAPNPRSRATGFDAGQRGWRIHAVLATDVATLEEIRNVPALCGLRPRHGWGMDLSIEARCRRCERNIRSGETVVFAMDKFQEQMTAFDAEHNKEDE